MMFAHESPVQPHVVKVTLPNPTISNTAVDYEEFCSLAVSSRRRLLRANDPVEGLCGLLDPATGERFVIAERDLRLRED